MSTTEKENKINLSKPFVGDVLLTPKEATKRRKILIKQLHQLFNKRWHHLFPINGKNIKPWKIGISNDLQKELKGQYPVNFIQKAVTNYYRRWTIRYSHALINSSQRFDLSNLAVSEITDKEKTYARKLIKKRNKIIS